MKELSCEMCGSTNVVKQDGVFVCQACGTKYSVEEAKKIMEGTVEVTGTVSIDNSSKLDSYKELLKKFFYERNYSEANTYANKILEIDSKDWEATHYKGLCLVYMDMEKTRKALANPTYDTYINYGYQYFTLTFEHANYFPENANQASVNALNYAKEKNLDIIPIQKQIAKDLLDFDLVHLELGETFYNVNNKYQEALEFYVNSLLFSTRICEVVLKEILDKNLASADQEIKDLRIKALQISAQSYAIGTSEFKVLDHYVYKWHHESFKTIKAPEPILELFAEQYEPVKSELEEYGISEDLPEIKEEEISQQSSSGGCYVATSIYGSYDCPEVWTLRRFRDNTLAKSIPGRLFIKFYYAVSPTVVKYFGDTKVFKDFFKPKLNKLVNKLQEEGVDSSFYIDQ